MAPPSAPYTVSRVAMPHSRRPSLTHWLTARTTITHVIPREPLTALTFDDGPHPEFTPHLLDILRRHDARATFFVIGAHAQEHPEIVARIVREGHALANHTYSHRRMTEMTSTERREEIARCAQVIAPFGGLPLFRPPQGRQNGASRLDVARAGHDCVGWNAFIGDWLPRDRTCLADLLAEAVWPGSVTLLHDAIWDPMVEGAEDRTNLLGAIDDVLRDGIGVRCVTLPELFAAGRVVRRVWNHT